MAAPQHMQHEYNDPLYLRGHGQEASINTFPVGTVGTYYEDGAVFEVPKVSVYPHAGGGNNTETCSQCGSFLFGRPCSYCD